MPRDTPIDSPNVRSLTRTNVDPRFLIAWFLIPPTHRGSNYSQIKGAHLCGPNLVLIQSRRRDRPRSSRLHHRNPMRFSVYLEHHWGAGTWAKCRDWLPRPPCGMSGHGAASGEGLVRLIVEPSFPKGPGSGRGSGEDPLGPPPLIKVTPPPSSILLDTSRIELGMPFPPPRTPDPSKHRGSVTPSLRRVIPKRPTS